MRRGPRVTIKMKLFAGLGVLVVLFAVILITAYVALDDAQKSQRKMLEENFGNLYDLPALRSNMNGQRLAVALMLETPRSGWGPWLQEIAKRRRTGDSLINNLIFRFRDVRTESERLGAFIAVREAYQQVQDTQKELLLDSNNIGRAKELFLGVQMENYARMRTIIGELEDIELREAREVVRNNEANAETRTREFVLLGIFGLFVAAALAVYMDRTVTSYVSEVSAAESETSKANRALTMINASNAIMIRATEEKQLLEDVCRNIVDLGGYKMAWVGYADYDKSKSVRPMAFAGSNGDYVEHAKISWADTERGRGPTGTCIRTGEVVIVKDISTETGYEPWRYRAVEKGYRSSATFPLKESKGVYGALMVYSGVPDAFDQNEVELLRELADDLAYATTALRDQSGLQRADKQTRESAVYARSLLESSLDPVMVINTSGNITDVNSAMEESTGRSRAELIGCDFADCFTEPERARNGHREVLDKGILRDYVLTIKHNSDRAVDVLFNARVFSNESGKLQGVFATTREIQRKM